MKVFWHKCGPNLGNLGDRLTLLLLDHFKVPVQWAPPEHAQLFGIGSILQRIPPRFDGIVWSTGLLEPSTTPNLSQARVLALRGRLTRAHTQLDAAEDNIVYGDGGLLCHLFQQPARRRFKLGVIPHYADTCPPLQSLPNAGRDIRLINICDDLHTVLHAISECEGIVSSSLHGLVLADALRVPNHWITFDSNRVLGNGFKFKDYYSNFELPEITPVTFNERSNLDTLLPLLENYQRPGLETIQQRLWDTLNALASEHRASPRHRGQLPAQQEKEASSWRRQRNNAKGARWNAEINDVIREISAWIPAGEPFALVDEEQCRHTLPSHLAALPFPEQNHAYGGVPFDNEDAIRQLERARESGVRYLAFIRNTFWWLEHYTGFRDHLLDCSETIVRNESVGVFKLHPNEPDRSNQGKPACEPQPNQLA